MMARKYIRHPVEIPLEVVVNDKLENEQPFTHDISYGGLCFYSQRQLTSGNDILIKIPLKKELFEIQAHVVWCHEKRAGFEVGVVFRKADEAYKVRMVEQICHIEQYQQQLVNSEGRELSGNEAASEWINKFAQQFPARD